MTPVGGVSNIVIAHLGRGRVAAAISVSTANVNQSKVGILSLYRPKAPSTVIRIQMARTRYEVPV
jgi:hypothetical protein